MNLNLNSKAQEIAEFLGKDSDFMGIVNGTSNVCYSFLRVDKCVFVLLKESETFKAYISYILFDLSDLSDKDRHLISEYAQNLEKEADKILKKHLNQ